MLSKPLNPIYYTAGSIQKVRWVQRHQRQWHRIMELAILARSENLYSTHTSFRDISFSLANYIQLAQDAEYLARIKGVRAVSRRGII